MNYFYQPDEQDLNDYRDYLISEEKAQISKLKSIHKAIMPERFFNAVVWDYEFPEVVEVTKEADPQMKISFEILEIF